MIRLVFVNEWSENGTSIAWQQEGRRRLNAVIRLYNDWQKASALLQSFSSSGASAIMALVDEGKQTWANQDGGWAWKVELEQIESLVRRTGALEEAYWSR